MIENELLSDMNFNISAVRSEMTSQHIGSVK